MGKEVDSLDMLTAPAQLIENSHTSFRFILQPCTSQISHLRIQDLILLCCLRVSFFPLTVLLRRREFHAIVCKIHLGHQNKRHHSAGVLLLINLLVISSIEIN